ncbi:MAG: hypothetical protein HC934_09965 [Acaryochloridaceae cyanobacterium SU_2_1]|nr:hypothetical protein [Acaryochloridaceae cyanobacterium SU_2_1]
MTSSSRRLLYERSVIHRGYLIIPYLLHEIGKVPIYAYRLLSELGHRGCYHRANNPSGLHSSHIDGIVAIAKEHLDQQILPIPRPDCFKRRYLYQQNLIIISEVGGKYFYDHYPPTRLNNIAAPKIFTSELHCASWVKQGLDRNLEKSTTTM